MLGKLILHIISGIIGLFAAYKYFHLIKLEGGIDIVIIAGIILGLVNFFVKPILNIITLPLRMLTLGLFSLIINMFLVWLAVNILFPNELEITGITPLFWTTVIVWILNLILLAYKPKKSKI